GEWRALHVPTRTLGWWQTELRRIASTQTLRPGDTVFCLHSQPTPGNARRCPSRHGPSCTRRPHHREGKLVAAQSAIDPDQSTLLVQQSLSAAYSLRIPDLTVTSSDSWVNHGSGGPTEARGCGSALNSH